MTFANDLCKVGAGVNEADSLVLAALRVDEADSLVFAALRASTGRRAAEQKDSRDQGPSQGSSSDDNVGAGE